MALRFIFFTVLGLMSAISFAGPLGWDSQSPHLHMGKQISATQYSRVETKKLKNAKLLWANEAYLRQHGYGDVTPVLEAEIIESWSYVIPSADDSAASFESKTKDFYVTRYGGPGLGLNLGDGRAGAAGKF